MRPTDEEDPKRRLLNDIGCDLSQLSADELTAPIALLEAEIGRLSREREAKQRGRLTAEGLFKSR